MRERVLRVVVRIFGAAAVERGLPHDQAEALAVSCCIAESRFESSMPLTDCDRSTSPAGYDAQCYQ